MKKKILLVDDEPDILELIGYNLRNEGYEVSTALNGREGIEIARKVKPDLIILDVMMPEMDGMEVCNIIRADENLAHTTIAFLTARSEDYSQLAGFDAGGDDYITKPVKPKILMGRVKALLRRSSRSTVQLPDERFGVAIDHDLFLVIHNGKELTLPKKEFELLNLLWSEPGKVFTREAILSHAWGNDVIVGDRTIDVHIRKLRSKLGDELFVTVKGVGYKFGA
jgi:two-component system alkaline phosphatase synthesis response regulator PhoP